jgi:hypothetical protein
MYFLILLFLSLIDPTLKSPKDFIWENRILIFQSNEFDSTWFDKDLEQHLKDRKLLVFEFDGEHLVKTNSEAKIDEFKFLGKLQTNGQKSNQWVLIGLDGGIKTVGAKVPTPTDIFRIIDAMPMRQSEIRKGGKDNF